MGYELRKLDVIKKDRILQFLSLDFAEPKRYSEIFEYVQGRDICKTKKSLTLYLRALIKDGLVERDEKGWREVYYRLVGWKKWRVAQEKYRDFMTPRLVRLTQQAKDLINDINNGVVPKEDIEGVVFKVWSVFQITSVNSLYFVFDVVGASYVVTDLINDMVLVPFYTGSKVIEMCYKMYPKETKKALEKLKSLWDTA